MHEASAGWVPPPAAVWGGTPANIGGPVTERAELVSHRDYATGNVVFRDGLPVALIDFDLAKPTTRLYDIANALWYWAPFKWGAPQARAPALADADIPHRVAVFADAYGMTARHRAELAPFAVDMARRYYPDSRDSAELDPVFRRLWQDGGKDVLPRRSGRQPAASSHQTMGCSPRPAGGSAANATSALRRLSRPGLVRGNRSWWQHTIPRCSGTRTAAAPKVLTSSVTTIRRSATAASSTRWSSAPRRPGRCAVSAMASTPSAARSSATHPG